MAGNKNSGRKATSGAARGRAWCREIVEKPEVRKMLEKAAQTDPMVALKLFEHGYGRAPQSLSIGKQEIEVRVTRG